MPQHCNTTICPGSYSESDFIFNTVIYHESLRVHDVKLPRHTKLVWKSRTMDTTDYAWTLVRTARPKKPQTIGLADTLTHN